jgi:hypothetical protein
MRIAQTGEDMEHPKPWLRYVDASKVSDKTLALDAMKVRSRAGDALGTVDGLVVDAESGRPFYVVVDAGGWFVSKQFLAPIGHVHLDPARDALIMSLTKEQIGRFPGFDLDEFESLSETDITRINDRIGEICEQGVPREVNTSDGAAWNRPAYRVPDWWAERSQAVSRDAGASGTSPYFDGRAQPGDVLGLETEGERTYVGDTKEDEDNRRREAQDEDRAKH